MYCIFGCQLRKGVDFAEHYELTHNSICCICKQSFSSLLALKEHVVTHEFSGDYCDVCGYNDEFMTLEHILIHKNMIELESEKLFEVVFGKFIIFIENCLIFINLILI